MKWRCDECGQVNPLGVPACTKCDNRFGTTIFSKSSPVIDFQQKIEELEDEIRILNIQLKNKSLEVGQSEHRGNTVDYIYDKLANYSKQLGECGNKNRELEKLLLEIERNACENCRKKLFNKN